MNTTINFLENSYILSNDNLIINSIKYKLFSITNNFQGEVIRGYFFDIDIDDNAIREIFPHSKKIVFQNCIFNKTFIINNRGEFVVFIDNCEFAEEVTIAYARFHSLSPTTTIATFHATASFYYSFRIVSHGSDVYSVDKPIQKEGLRAGNFIFKGETYFYDVYFNTPFEEERKKRKKEQEFKEVFEFFLDTKNNASGSLSFIQCDFNDKFKIRSAEAKYKNYLKEQKDKKGYLKEQKDKAELKSLKIIGCTVKNGSYLRFGFLSIEEFELKNLRLSQDSELNIGDCQFTKFTLSNFRNIGKFKLYKTNILEGEKGELFQIDNTSIGDADFQSVSLNSFSEVKMFDNIFHNFKYTNIIWKDIVEVGQTTSNKNILEKQQDTYRTLKNVAQLNNDQPQAIKFYAKEMKSYKDLIKHNKAGYSLSDRVTLWFNDLTNDFGLSWWKPLLILLFLITPIFYFLLLWCSNIPIFNLHHWQYVVQFLNPIHKFDWVVGFFPNLIDILFRALEGLLLYQVITAFRKYSKKL